MRIVFMGTPDFSVPALNALVDAGHEVAAVVTQPDRPKGRGKDVQMTPVKLQALEYGIPVYQPEKVKDPAFVEILKELHPEAIVVIAFGQILSKAILDIPPYGCVNIHASLLPKYRRYHHDDGCGTGYGRHAGKDGDPSGSEGNRRKPV